MRVLVVHSQCPSENPSHESIMLDLEVGPLRGGCIKTAPFENAEHATSARRSHAREFAPLARLAALLSVYRTAREQ